MAFDMGDRHLSNIMIQADTGTLLNIDFELMLGSGKDLPVPEIVPLRISPMFRKAFGLKKQHEIYSNILASYMQHISRRKIKIFLEFLELCMHQGQKSFTTKTDIYNPDVTHRIIMRILEQPKQIQSGFDSRQYWENQVLRVIDMSTDKFALDIMFCGWQPNF